MSNNVISSRWQILRRRRTLMACAAGGSRSSNCPFATGCMVNQAPMTNKFTFRNQSMKSLWRIFIGTFFILAGVLAPANGTAEDIAVALPAGVKAVWDIAKAEHATTPTRERICINGLWRWQPARADAAEVPAKNWGYFKVPGCWPGITDYMQKDSQTRLRPSELEERKSGRAPRWPGISARSRFLAIGAGGGLSLSATM